MNKDVHLQALKIVNNLYIEAIAKDVKVMIQKWGDERNRITTILSNWEEEQTNE